MINKATVYCNENKLFVHIMSFGEWLRQKINNGNLSNAEVARRAKLSPTYIGNLVRDYSPNTKKGVGRPSEEAVEKIARAVASDLNEARIAAGYAPNQKPSDFDAKVRAAFQGADKFSDEEKERVLEAVKTYVAGVRARRAAEAEKAENQ